MGPRDDTTGTLASLETAQATAAAFAHALDGGDLAAVGELLAPQCEYVEGATRLSGAPAVLEALRHAASWAERGFDDVRPVSSIAAVTAGRAEFEVVIVWMRVPGRWHRLSFERTLDIRADGRVVRLAQCCEAGAARAFAAFVRDSAVPPAPLGFGIPKEE